MLHLGANRTYLDLSGLLFDQRAVVASPLPWKVVAQYPRGAVGLLSNMSTVEREVTMITTADEARRVAVPPYAVVSVRSAGSSSVASSG